MSKYPHGKLRPDDEGELAVRLTVKHKTLFIDFGKDVKWIALPLDQAKAFAELILQRVNEEQTR